MGFAGDMGIAASQPRLFYRNRPHHIRAPIKLPVYKLSKNRISLCLMNGGGVDNCRSELGRTVTVTD
jgi:hypothetical protein